MKDKPIRGDKFWRTSALIILCGLVYYFSYDQGRQAENVRYQAYQLETVAEAENQRREIIRLSSALLQRCEPGGTPLEPQALANAPEVQPLDDATVRLSLRANQSRLLFDDRLVLTLLEVNSLEGRAVFRFNFLLEERILTGELKTGDSFKFPLDRRQWALVLSSLTISSANMSLVELKESKP